MSWMVLVFTLGLVSLAGLVYIVSRFRRFSRLRALREKRPALSWLAALAAAVLPLGVTALLVNLFTAVIVFLHLLLIWLLCDCVGGIVRRVRGVKAKRYWPGAAALALTVLVIFCGWLSAYRVRRTAYTVETGKALSGPVRVAEIADSHIGVTLSAERFARELEKIRGSDPDLLVIAGDFVDDDTAKPEMLAACRALGELKLPYGVFYVYGNHDRGYYRHKDFSSGELRQALADAGVTVLEDSAAKLDCGMTVIGRKDRSFGDRLSAARLTEGADPDSFLLMLDHQPNDYAAEAAAGADLVLSGHTHGGHIWPAGLIGLALGANDRVYGYERRAETDFIVTSGIAGWAIPIKTGTFSEYVIIDVVPSTGAS